MDGLVYTMFKSALELYYIKNNSALFVELHGLLERIAVDKMCDFISVNKEARIILLDAFSKKTLNEVAEYFQTINIWDNADIAFAKRLTKIRNGIAHKNAKLVSKNLSDGKQASITSINEITKKTDVIPFVLQTIGMILKISDVLRPNLIKEPKFSAKLEAYNLLIGPILNLHGELLLGNYDPVISAVILNRLYSKAILLSDDVLGNDLLEFRDKVIELHIQLRKGDSDAIAEAHKIASDLATKIIKEMKESLSHGDFEYDNGREQQISNIKQLRLYLTQIKDKEAQS